MNSRWPIKEFSWLRSLFLSARECGVDTQHDDRIPHPPSPLYTQATWDTLFTPLNQVLWQLCLSFKSQKTFQFFFLNDCLKMKELPEKPVSVDLVYTTCKAVIFRLCSHPTGEVGETAPLFRQSEQLYLLHTAFWEEKFQLLWFWLGEFNVQRLLPWVLTVCAHAVMITWSLEDG